MGIKLRNEATRNNEKEVGQIINFRKTASFFISIPHSIISPNRGDLKNLPDNLVNLADLIQLFQNEPFGIPENKIHKLIYPRDSDQIYSKIRNVMQDNEIENVLIFYQGFGYKKNSELILVLDEHAKNINQSNSLSLEKLSKLLNARKDLNIIFFIDCNNSALAFNSFNTDSYVLISSSGEDQGAHIVKISEENRRVSLFSYVVVNTFKELKNGSMENCSVYDFFLQIRSKINNKGNQIPEISTRNAAPYLRILGNIEQKSKKEKKYSIAEIKNLVSEDKLSIALEVLSLHLDESEKDVINQLIMLKMRFKNNESAKILGLISRDDYTINHNNIAVSILTFSDSLSEKY